MSKFGKKLSAISIPKKVKNSYKPTATAKSKAAVKANTARVQSNKHTGEYLAPSIDKRENYVQTLLTNTMGNTFYASEKSNFELSKSMHEKIVKLDPEFMAKAIAYAREKGMNRTNPVYGLAYLACANTDVANQLFKEYFGRVVKIPTDLFDFFAAVKSIKGKSEGGRKIKKTAAEWLRKNLTEYWTIKYGSRNEGKGGEYSLKDIIAITHPNFDGKSEGIDFLFGRLEKPSDMVPQIKALEKLRKAKSDSVKAKLIESGKLPHEVVTTYLSNEDIQAWKAVVKQMPVFALVRNLATIERHGLLTDKEIRSFISSKLTDSKTIQHSKMWPIHFYKAYKAVVDNPFLSDLLKNAIELSFSNLPEIEGRTAIHLDISGSMQNEPLMTASLFAIGLAKKTDWDTLFYLFDTQAEKFRMSKTESIMSQASKIHARGGTDTGVALRQMVTHKEKVDNIILITDEQQNTGAGFLNVLKTYKSMVNPYVKVFIVNVAPYCGHVADSSPLENIYKIYGFSDKVLEYISLASKGWGTITDCIEKLENVDPVEPYGFED